MQTVFEPAGLLRPVHKIWNDDIERLVFLGISHRGAVHQQLSASSTYYNHAGPRITLKTLARTWNPVRLVLDAGMGGLPLERATHRSQSSATTRQRPSSNGAGDIRHTVILYKLSFGSATVHITLDMAGFFLWHGTSLFLLGFRMIFA